LVRPSGSQSGADDAGAAEVAVAVVGTVGVTVVLSTDGVGVGVDAARVGVRVGDAGARAVGEAVATSCVAVARGATVLVAGASVAVAGEEVLAATALAVGDVAVVASARPADDDGARLFLAQPATREEISSKARPILRVFLISAVSFALGHGGQLAPAACGGIIAPVWRPFVVLAEFTSHRLERDPVKPKNTRYLVLVGVVSLLVVIGLVSLDPLDEQESWLVWLVRGAALLGYWSVFLSILSSAYLRELVRFFGRSFVKVHHVASVTGLVLIATHPLAVAINTSNVAVFLPRFDSLYIFLSLGGRLAWYLIGIASLAALLRTNLRRSWRVVHWLNYIAFFLASVHASLIGTTFRGQGVRAIILKVIVGILSLIAVYVFVRRQVARRRRRR
jgi:hypothetical protein